MPLPEPRPGISLSFVRFRLKGLALLLAFGLAGSCQVNLPATRWGGLDGASADAQDALRGPAADGASQGGLDSGSCREAVFDLTVPNGSVMLVAERSTVMSTPNDNACAACGTYWTSLQVAAAALTSAKSNHFRWGLKLFPSPSGADACLVSSAMEVPLAFDNSASILSALGAAPAPNGGAPTTLAVSEVYSYFHTMQDRKSVV
jgi:hypothetical protein